MAELTLERIAELREGVECDLVNGWNTSLAADIVLSLLDAAERGLTQDRKAAAFDRLAAINELDIQTFGETKFIYDHGGASADGPTLLEAVEALPQTNGEPKQ